MQPRQLLIVAVAVLVAFGAAFGIAKAGGGDESDASGAVKPAEVIEVGEVTVAAGAVDTGGLPALRVPEKTPEPTADPSDTPGPEATVAPTGTVTPSSTAPPTSTQPPQDDGGELSGGEE